MREIHQLRDLKVSNIHIPTKCTLKEVMHKLMELKSTLDLLEFFQVFFWFASFPSLFIQFSFSISVKFLKNSSV